MLRGYPGARPGRFLVATRKLSRRSAAGTWASQCPPSWRRWWALAQLIQPEPVFPDLPEPIPPAGFLALRLYITVRPVPPRYQATRFTVGGYVAVLPADGRKWQKYTVGNSWTLRLAALTIGTSALDDVWFSFTEDDLAAPSGAASCRVIRAGGQRIDGGQSLAIQRAVLSIAENSA